MNTIDILIEGYAKVTDTGWEASSSCCLITCHSGEQSDTRIDSGQARMTNDEGVIKIITDPGANKDLLFGRLKEKGLKLEDIDYVFLTHHHLDHAMDVGLFPNAKIIDEEAIYNQDKAVEGVKMIPDTDITVIATPGHEYAHASLVVPTEKGTVVIAGDCFWFEEGQQEEFVRDGKIIDKEKLLNKKDDFADKIDELVASRKMILDLADWVVPGHGKVFEVEK